MLTAENPSCKMLLLVPLHFCFCIFFGGLSDAIMTDFPMYQIYMYWEEL